MRVFISLKLGVCRTFQPARSAAASTLAGTCKRNVLAPWLIALAFALTAQQGHACTLNVTGVNFGSYDVFSNSALDSTGNIDVNCPNGVGYSIELSARAAGPIRSVSWAAAPTRSTTIFTPPLTVPLCGATPPAAPLQ